MFSIFTKADIHLKDWPNPMDKILKDRPFKLQVAATIFIEPVSFAQIPHNLKLETNGNLVVIMRSPETFLKHHLIVDQGPVVGGELYTSVFNISDARVRVPKGEVISWLVEL